MSRSKNLVTSCLREDCCKEFEGWTGTKKLNKFCSLKCQQEYQWVTDHVPRIIAGTHPNPRKIRKYLLRERGVQCEICGIKEWMGQPVPVVMDHINGDPTNDKLDNLRVICCNCDALLPTYKAKNRGNGRVKRRERYAAGKSF